MKIINQTIFCSCFVLTNLLSAARQVQPAIIVLPLVDLSETQGKDKFSTSFTSCINGQLLNNGT